MSLGVRSAGEETGDFAHIYVNGIDFAPNERGYNLVALTDGGEVLDAQAFDTHASPEASEAMAAWLEQWPAGTVIAGAVADEASLSLQEEAVQALATLGVGTDLRGKFRWGHAFVGVAGAEAGTALEEAGLIRPADVSVGPPLDAPAATGGVGAIRFSAVRLNARHVNPRVGRLLLHQAAQHAGSARARPRVCPRHRPQEAV